MSTTLRPIEVEDLAALRDWRNQLRKQCREYRFLNMVNQKDWFEEMSRDRSMQMLAIEHDGELAGVCGLAYIRWTFRSAEVSLYVAPEFQGMGIGKEALWELIHLGFGELNLHRLWAEIFEFNDPAIKLFEGAGFRCEGRLKDSAFWDGRYYASFIYGKVRDDQA